MNVALRQCIAVLAAAALTLGASASQLMGQDESTPDARQLNQRMLDAYRAGDYDKSIEIGLKLIERTPRDSNVQYNLACLYALKGDKATALDWLKKSADGGFFDIRLARTDPDLKSLHGEAAYKSALETIQGNSERALGEFKSKAEASKPLVVVPPDLDKSKPAPLIVALHPYGATAEWIVGRWRDVAKERGAILAAPRAVRSEGQGFQWGAVNEADLIVTNALKQVMGEHNIDKDRVVLTGYSQGAMMSFALGAKHAKVFSGVIPVAGSFDLTSEELSGGELPKFYIMIGDKDEALASNRKAAKDLEGKAKDVEIIIYENLGHTFPSDPKELTKALDFVFGAK